MEKSAHQQRVLTYDVGRIAQLTARERRQVVVALADLLRAAAVARREVSNEKR